MISIRDKFEQGSELPPLELPPISRATLALYAGASGDYNPIHIDIDVAHSAGLEDVFSHGMLSMAYLGRLITNWLPQSDLREFSARFVSITPVHARPTCRGRVVAVEVHHDVSTVTVDVEVVLPDGTVTLRGEAVFVLAEG